MRFALTLLLAAEFSGALPGSEKTALAVDAPRTAEVTVHVFFPDGSPAAGAAVTVGRGTFSADGKGVVAVPGIPETSGVASADIGRREGGFLGLFRKTVRYAAFSPLAAKAGAPLEVRLTLAPVAEMDALCRSCHPAKPTGANRIVKCAHPSGIPLKPAEVTQVRNFNKQNEGLRKTGKPNYPPIVVEMRKGTKALFAKEREFLVCESCHSNHVETGNRAYVLMPFDDKSVLCRGCHV